MFPPVEIITKVEGYSISNVTPSSDIKSYNEGELKKKILEKYSCLYPDASVIENLNIKSISNSYTSLMRCVNEHGIMRFSFDLPRFVDIFHFDKGLVNKKFREGPIPFVVEYKFDCSMQNPTSDDTVIHKIIFNSFFGGNPIIGKTSSKMFKYIQSAKNPGQIILTNKN